MNKIKSFLNWVITSNKKRWISELAVFSCIAFLTCFFSLTHLTKLNAASTSTLLGIYYGDADLNSIANINAMETWQGKKHAIVHVFANWCDSPANFDGFFDQQLVNIWNNQSVPMISWEPVLCHPSCNPTDEEVRTATPSDIEIRTVNGEFDIYLSKWADRMQVFLSGPDGVYNTADDRRAYIRFAHEMNGAWYPWAPTLGSGGNPASDYINMWQRVRNIFSYRGMGSTHLQWIWSINSNPSLAYPPEQLYPGDNYVDWVGISGYNWGTSQTWSSWETPEQTFGVTLSRLRALTTKPIAITEVATTGDTTTGTSVAAKSQGIIDFLKYALDRDIKMVVWFNDAKETDWKVFGGFSGDSQFDYSNKRYNAFSGYKASVGSSIFVPSNPANPRLLTDAQFAGL